MNFYTFKVVTVYCGEERFEEIPSALLVPGDVIVVPSGNKLMACDAVLVSHILVSFSYEYRKSYATVKRFFLASRLLHRQ